MVIAMVKEPYEQQMDRERKLLEDELLPGLEAALSGYEVVDMTEEAEEAAENLLDAEDYDLPMIEAEHLGVTLLPEYFLVDEGQADAIEDGEYAVAIEPEYKAVELADDNLYDDVIAFAERWEEETNVTTRQSLLGEVDTAEVTLYQ